MAGRASEFLYRVPGAPGGVRPGAHRSRSVGPGLEIAAHARLFDQPDPRRLDLRASLASVPREWLVRTYRQRSAVTLQAIVDVSASMRVASGPTGPDDRDDGGAEDKLASVLDFLAALGASAFRSGDAVGLSAFDARARDELYRAPRTGRGAGIQMREAIAGHRRDTARRGDLRGLAECVERLGPRVAIVFIVSDFHFDLDGLPAVLERLGDACVVPLVVRDAAELEPPAGVGWISVRDAESGKRRQLWLRDSTRRRWRERVAARRREIDAAFGARDVRPFWIEAGFDAERLSRHFLEHVA